MRFIVTMTGLDGSLGQTIHARHIYEAEQVVWDARFVDVMSNTPDGLLQIDYRRFHDVVPQPPT
jgi:inward rectifier potassium channel